MSTQLLIYENVVPISKERHAKWSLQAGKDFKHTEKLNLVPLLATEFLAAAREYPIVFSKKDDQIQTLALLGFREGENFFLDEKGNWTASYIPAFLRRYPFVFSRSEDGKQFTLCIDESFPGFDKSGKKGEKLFAKDGKTTPFVENVLKFLQAFHNDQNKTQALCKKLDELDLFQPQNALWTGTDGQKAALTGFHCLDRAKLKDVPTKMLKGMIESGELDLIYAHLMSLGNFNRFKDNLAKTAVAAG